MSLYYYSSLSFVLLPPAEQSQANLQLIMSNPRKEQHTHCPLEPCEDCQKKNTNEESSADNNVRQRAIRVVVPRMHLGVEAMRKENEKERQRREALRQKELAELKESCKRKIGQIYGGFGDDIAKETLEEFGTFLKEQISAPKWTDGEGKVSDVQLRNYMETAYAGKRTEMQLAMGDDGIVWACIGPVTDLEKYIESKTNKKVKLRHLPDINEIKHITL